jgi:cytidine deaminase
MTNKELCELAMIASGTSYSPYSNFRVGAALLCADGSVFAGCNVENSSYSVTVCAERTAFFKALSEGKKDFVSIAIVGGREEVGKTACTPCGVCLQVMAEFCDPKPFKILLPSENDIVEYTLSDLLPKNFSL